MCRFLLQDGLSVEILQSLSFRTNLGLSLKNSLAHFTKAALLHEIEEISVWYDEHEALEQLALDYRVKSLESASHKYDRYFPDRPTAKVFNDLLGFRSLRDDYDEILKNPPPDALRIVNMSHGKANDDGYRGVHVYYQLDNFHYPIEIQYNTYFDRQLNNCCINTCTKSSIRLLLVLKCAPSMSRAKLRMKQNFRRCYPMCYVVAKNANKIGSVAIRMKLGTPVVQLKAEMNSRYLNKGIQFVTISRPSAYGEYAPYRFVDTIPEFKAEVAKL